MRLVYMKHSAMRCLAALLLLIGGAGTAAAVPITYVLSGTGSGQFNHVNFSDRAVSFTLHGNTANVVDTANGTVNNAVTGTVDVAGIGTLGLVGVNIQSFGLSVGNSCCLYSVIVQDTSLAGGSFGTRYFKSPPYTVYELRGNYGPATFPSATGSASDVFRTVGGGYLGLAGLSFTGGVTVFATTAAAVPEPAGLAVLGVGVAGLALVRKRRRGTIRVF